MTYEERFTAALRRAKNDYPILGWYNATEAAADAYDVSLPELQRAFESILNGE